jgi:hypothetical protein
MLVQWSNPPFRTYFVWSRYSALDDEEQARAATRKYPAPNATYFWMPVPALSQELITVLKLGAGRFPFDIYLLYKRGVLWDSQVPSPTYWQQQMGVIQGEPFNIARLGNHIQSLLTR